MWLQVVWKIEICFGKGWKHSREKEKMQINSIFSFSHNFQKASYTGECVVTGLRMVGEYQK